MNADEEVSVNWDSPAGSSSSGVSSYKHVVIVMDGMKEFNTEPLEWALQNIISAGCTVTLLGVMPWLNIPLSSKTWLDVWPVKFEDLEEKTDSTTDARYAKLQAVIDLCRKYGVKPQKEVVMGYPPRLLILEKISSLCATWVVFDRHHRKHREFFAEKLKCNVVMMIENGEVDMINGGNPLMEAFTPLDQSPAPSSLAPTPQVMLSDDLKDILNDNDRSSPR